VVIRDVAADDHFRAEPDADGLLWAGERLHWSGNCTIRVIPFAEGPLAGSQQAVLDLLLPMGGSWAYEESCISSEWTSA